MRRLFAGALGLVVVVISLAPSMFAQTAPLWVGTWKSDLAKSTYSPGPPPTIRSQILRNEAIPNGIKSTLEIIDAQGHAIRREITAMADGKEYELKGAVMPTTRVYQRIDNHGYEYVERVNGRVTATTRADVSADGKTRMNTATGTNAQGQKFHNVVLSEKQ